MGDIIGEDACGQRFHQRLKKGHVAKDLVVGMTYHREMICVEALVPWFGYLIKMVHVDLKTLKSCLDCTSTFFMIFARRPTSAKCNDEGQIQKPGDEKIVSLAQDIGHNHFRVWNDSSQ